MYLFLQLSKLHILLHHHQNMIGSNLRSLLKVAFIHANPSSKLECLGLEWNFAPAHTENNIFRHFQACKRKAPNVNYQSPEPVHIHFSQVSNPQVWILGLSLCCLAVLSLEEDDLARAFSTALIMQQFLLSWSAKTVARGSSLTSGYVLGNKSLGLSHTENRTVSTLFMITKK